MAKMGLWLFHRRSHKRSRSGANLSDPDVNAQESHEELPQRSQTFDVQSKPKRQRTSREPNKLRRRNRNYSYSPGRQDLIRVSSQRRRSREFSPHLQRPHQASTFPQHKRPKHPVQTYSPPRQIPQPPGGPGSRNGSHEWFRIPTLRNRPPSAQTGRTKSSGRRRVDRDRETQIRAMASNFEPLRPAAEQWTSGRPMRKDSRRVKNGFFSPASDISLPSAASIRSSMSSDSEHAAFRVSAKHPLAPRPTLRYSSMHHQHQNLYSVYGQSTADDRTGPVRSRSQRTRLAERPPIPEATLRAHKRVDELADGLTASEIRELMERDKRRRDRKKQREQERTERRLARQAHKEQLQREQEAAQRSGGPNLERGVLGRELAGLGVRQPPSAVITSSRPRASTERVDADHMDIDEEGTSSSNRESTASSQPRPLEQFHRAESIHVGEAHDDVPSPDAPGQPRKMLPPTPPSEPEEALAVPSDIAEEDEEPSPAVAAVIEDASGFPERKASINRRKSDRRVLVKKDRSKSPPLTHETQGTSSPPPRQDDHSATQKSSETGGSGRTSIFSWSALFKWRGKNKRSLADPSSFSNASRDSQTAPSAAGATGASASTASATSSTPYPSSVPIAPNVTFIPPRRDGSISVPRRTMSRFREDLPETVVSPQSSRFQSPGTERGSHAPVAGENIEPEPHSDGPTPTQETYNVSQREVDRMTPTSMQTLQMSSVDPSPEPQSMSLASVDSEASWFGGGLGGRKRARLISINKYQQLEQRQHERSTSAASNTNNTEDEFGLAEDEYFTRLSPASDHHLRISTVGEPRPSSDGSNNHDDGEATWGTLPRIPTVHEARKMKSSEALHSTAGEINENESGDDGDIHVDCEKEDSGIDTEPDSPEDDDETSGVQRATSINLGRSHVRHISAGSAKLLELTPRGSVDAKRRSYEPPATITQ